MTDSAYTQAGVNIDAKMDIISRIKRAVDSTHGPEVLAGVGAFGGLYRAGDTILVGSTDGVGTKTMVAAAAGRFRGLGHDIVNHCVNDILCQGARPLFFLDYVASSKLAPDTIVDLVEGIAEACRAAGCALLGGETAEMPGVYQSSELDVVGTIVGLVEPGMLLPTDTIRPGDVLIGLPSSGAHTNGYSLIRKAFENVPLATHFDGIGILGDALLAPHRCYLPEIASLRKTTHVKALAHITGGGFYDNIPRILPSGVGVTIDRGTWTIPPLFALIQQRMGVSDAEMYRVFNMGIGMVVIVDPAEVPSDTQLIGRVVTGQGVTVA
jgi:phosphoribosylaminoimidazole synthetase